MLSLESDKTYRLQPVSNLLGDFDGPGDGKVYIHVKFTDSSFKAIEEYAARVFQQKKALGHNTNLSIEFTDTGESGYFDVPTNSDKSPSGSSSNNVNIRRFQFGFAPIPSEGGSASFECFQQKKSSDCLPAFGTFARRLTVKAQEDVFDATRERMAAVVEEHEKNKAREINASGPSKGAAVSRRATSLGQPSSSATVTKQTTTQSQVTNPNQLYDAASLAKRKAAERMAAMQKESSSSASAKPAAPSQPQYSLRERVLYSLAIKSQTEAQLISGLKLMSRDQIDLVPILKQLCQPISSAQNMSQSGNAIYQLRRESFGDVKIDHPLLANAEDKIAYRKNMAAAQFNKDGTGSTGQQKPQRPPPGLMGDQAGPAKQRRLDGDVTGRQSLPVKSVSAQAPVASKTRPQIPVGKSNLQNGHVVTPATGSANSSMSSNSSSLKPSPNKDSMDSLGGRGSSSRGNNMSASSSSNSASCSPDLSNYQAPQILTREQRSLMKQDFMDKYAEYRKLHDALSEKTACFREMRPQLEACEPGSERYRSIEEAIRVAYSRLQEDESYVAAKRKLDDLHVTLARIKQAIEDFDVSSGAVSGSQAPSAVTSMS